MQQRGAAARPAAMNPSTNLTLTVLPSNLPLHFALHLHSAIRAAQSAGRVARREARRKRADRQGQASASQVGARQHLQGGGKEPQTSTDPWERLGCNLLAASLNGTAAAAADGARVLAAAATAQSSQAVSSVSRTSNRGLRAEPFPGGAHLNSACRLSETKGIALAPW